MNTVRFSVPVPAPVLSPNHHGHFWVRARAVKQHRWAWYVAALAERLRVDHWEPLGPATLSVAVTWCGHRKPLDDDNLWASLKAGRDGLVDAGILTDDSPDCLTQGTARQTHCPRGCHCGGELVVTLQSEEHPG